MVGCDSAKAGPILEYFLGSIQVAERIDGATRRPRRCKDLSANSSPTFI